LLVWHAIQGFFVQLFTRQKPHRIIYIQMFGVPFKFHLRVGLIFFWRWLVIIRERFGHILWSTRVIYLLPSLSGRLW